MNENNNKDKAIFAVGLLAAILAFSPFEDSLKEIIIFSLPGKPSLSLLEVLFLFALFLAISVYLFALDYVKYGFGLKAQNNFIFKSISFFANLVYSFAIFFPIFIFIMAILLASPIDDFALRYKDSVLIFNIVGGGIYLIFILWNTVAKIKRMKQERIILAEDRENDELKNATRLFRDGYFSESILSSYKVLEFSLSKQLSEAGVVIPPETRFREILSFATGKILTQELSAKINSLVTLRNRAVHENVSLTKEQAEFALNMVREILSDISKSQFKNK